MQYPAWVAARKGLDFLHTPNYCVRVRKDAADPTMTGAELRAYYSDRIDMVDRASFECGCPQYVLKGILDSLSYEKLLLKYPAFIRYTKEKYYICKSERYIIWSELRKKIVYDDDARQMHFPL